MSQHTIPVSTLGTPRIGPRRELKFATEAYWSGKLDEAGLLEAASGLRAANWVRQKQAGVTNIPSNDFSLYDQVLDCCIMVGAVPERFGPVGETIPLAQYFAMARGSRGDAEAACCAGHAAHAKGAAAMEMTKWFDTNYHFMVPELAHDQQFRLISTKPVDEFLEARALGIHTRPVILGPVTFLKLAKATEADFDPLALLPRLLPVYAELLRQLQAAGADWVQIDEPALVLDLIPNERDAFAYAYKVLADAAPGVRLMLATYFGALQDNLQAAVALPVAGLHIDLVRAPEQLDAVLSAAPRDLVLSLGVIDGRNIWRANLTGILDRVEPIIAAYGTARFQIAPSCSLLHVPIDLELETDLDADVREWLAFSIQKQHELATLAAALTHGRTAVADELAQSDAAAQRRRSSPKVNNAAVQARTGQITAATASRASGFHERAARQRDRLPLPDFPTTTIGSFPQTADVRKARSSFAKGAISQADYDAFLRDETARAITWQEDVGLDVLVHGEFERNDMVQYFGEQLEGFTFTRHGWVQSYGSRCVRPPVLFGDVSRPAPMTVAWWRYAQSLTQKPVKGMLTGPVTILNWSFVRDDLPRSQVCRQIALAVRDEVIDLEQAGANIIQIDEAALREGLPLRRKDWGTYLQWAVECFRISASGVADETQIHTHMCYSEFNDIIDSIAAMDADVISIETSRSHMELLQAFSSFDYPNDIGPGVYDIHSPRVPSVDEMHRLLMAARTHLSDRQLWVNPDCGLKTRNWAEVRPAIANMVAAAQQLRSGHGA